MNIKVLYTGNTFSEKKIKELKIEGFNIISRGMDLTEDQVIKELEGCQAYILGGYEIATKKIIESTKDLKLITFFGTGYEKYVDIDTAKKKGIIVTNTPHANVPTVAEYTVGLILGAVKKIVDSHNATKKGQWIKKGFWNLKGKTLGIIGMGHIGSRVASILHHGFGMKVIYYSRSSKPSIDKALSTRRVELKELLSNSDVVSINCSLSSETKGLIGKKELELMRSNAVL